MDSLLIDKNEKYEEIRNDILNEYPNPYFYLDKAGDILDKLKKDFPNMTIQTDTRLGSAICIDDTVRMMMAYKLLCTSRLFLYVPSIYFDKDIVADADMIYRVDGLWEEGEA